MGGPEAAGVVPDGRRPALRSWLPAAFGLAAVLLCGLFVVRRRAELADALSGLSWPAIAAALVLAVLGQLAALGSFRALTADLGSPLPVLPAGRVFSVSQLGKYVPGGVWGMVLVVTLAARYAVPRRTTTAVGVTFLLVSTGTAVSVAAVLLPFGATESARHFWYVAPLLPLILLGLHPRVVVGVLDMGLRRVGRPPVPSRMSYPGILRAAGWQLLSWLLLGLHAWVLALALGATASATTVAVAVGGFALGYGLGPLVVVTPAGAGVRETALVLTLGGVLGGSSAALAVALVSRLLLVVTEFGQAGVWTLLARRADAAYAGPLSPAAGSSATAARAP